MHFFTVYSSAVDLPALAKFSAVLFHVILFNVKYLLVLLNKYLLFKDLDLDLSGSSLFCTYNLR